MSSDVNHDAIERALTRDGSAWRDGSPPPGSACVDAETLAAWAEGALPAVQGAEVETHLAECARCQEMAAAFAVTEPASAPALTRAPVIERSARGRRWWRPVAGSAIAASIVLFAVLRQKTAAPAPIDLPSIKSAVGLASPDPANPPRGGVGVAPEAARRAAKQTPGGFRDRKTPSATRPAEAAPPSPARALPPPALVPPTQLPVTSLPGVPVIPSPKPVTLQDTRANARNTEAMAFTLAPRIEFSSPDVEVAMQPTGATAGRVAAGGRGGGGRGGNAAANAAATVNRAAESPVTRWRITPPARVERSTDNGATWTTLDLGPRASAITAGAAPSRLVCWLVGRGGVVLESADGLTFTAVSFPEAVDLVKIVMTGPVHAVITAADGRTFMTEDGGLTWKK